MTRTGVSFLCLVAACSGGGSGGTGGAGGNDGGGAGGGGGSGGGGGDGGKVDAPGDAAPPGTAGDGFHRISVAQPHGTSDDVWIYAVSPAGDGPLPVVVYARGKGSGDVVNCAPTAGADGKVLGSDVIARARWLADLGYLSVAIAYRNVGDGAPGVGKIKFRDEGTRDARAALAAAQWARREHRRGSARVAYVGSSMGTWVVFWAASTRPDLADLQVGLDPRTTIMVAETTNHLRNAADDASYGPLLSSDPKERAIGILSGAVGALMIGSLVTGASVVGEADSTSGPLGTLLAENLTPKGIEVVRLTTVRAADESLKSCGGAGAKGKPPVCSIDCAGATMLSLLPPGATDPGPNSDWLKPPLLEALGYWRKTPIDPGPSPANPLVKAMRNGSPMFAADGLRVKRALSLLSVNDAHYDAAAHKALIAKLAALGATIPDPPPTIAKDAMGNCTHEDYLDATRTCGFAQVRDELAAAFAAP